MAEQGSDKEATSNYYRPWWLEKKEERYSTLNRIFNYEKIYQVVQYKLPPWTSRDLEQFAKENPQDGENLKVIRKVSELGLTGGVLGGLGAALISYRVSHNPTYAALTFVFGSVALGKLTSEITSVALGAHTINPLETNLKFLEWWKERTTK